MSAALALRQDVEFPYTEVGIATSGYQPRSAFTAFHSRSSRFSSLVCHRRAGKTVACINDVVARAMYTRKKNARYAYIAPFYRQAKDVAWQYLKESTQQFSVSVRESELRIILPNGSWITLYGADNIDALRGLYFDGVVIDEYGDCRPGLWGEVILPTLADRRGWAVFIGTPKGNNHFKKQHDRIRKDGGFTMILKAEDSGILDPSDLAELRSQMSDEEWQQEMCCSFQAALRGAYYGDLLAKLESNGRVKLVPFDPDFPVSVATDLGFTDSTALWFWQVRPDGLAIVDYYENHSKSLDHYFEILREKEADGYNLDTIWLPHDAKAKTLQTGRSTVQQFLEEDFPIRIAPRLDRQDGVQAVRRILPMCHFDEEKTFEGREALKSYRRRFDPLTQAFSNEPRHDWASHGADAFRVLALVTTKPLAADTNLKELEPTTAPRSVPVKLRDINSFTLDELHADRSKVISMAGRRRRV